MAILDLSSLKKAVGLLEEGLELLPAGLRLEDSGVGVLLRDGLIQRFEFTYELAHKMLKRFLELSSASPQDIDRMAFQDLIRTGNEQGLLLGNWGDWKRYRQARTNTSHTYDVLRAMDVVALVPEFLAEVRFLLVRLEERVDDL